MGVSSLISRSVRTLGGALTTGFLEDEARMALSSLSCWLPETTSFVSEGRVLSLSCWINLRERDRPVPS